ncbi:YraN family protein [Candidatus Berkelbacteria bacterium]|uniref:UPF0102 protein COT79_00780 n=1 Tax=Candidatus Berkelbacteria bacterium CG10_big_fil_rev_8_21_14_0_10_43_14 TaxID=1974515 RepID=A0A2M6R9I6_9BACT|nr:YraN family protein [Candidatus Berkelbacteria bacterium]OIP06458.1 MAG: YraN family protein [Candidatus Berkelbacteria bacterium CG2_30_43_20]PIS07146.1 MAG: YraN family protein [Candidatus Berkelbacteria bacterium CG10_big_fil_rev_8_21_14_0_10_43_14]PIU86975.1 MAG: YraN family protein [Candidatus Berkelbacteria bacterium CG06_land_8_20_14_3_00_43_10]
MKLPTKPTGNKGEELATAYLKQCGYRIVKRNWRVTVGEIDILARDSRAVVIVEVKTKTTPSFGHPAEMVNYYKQQKLLQLARYCSTLHPDTDIRIDVVSVDLSGSEPNIEHYINAVTT